MQSKVLYGFVSFFCEPPHCFAWHVQTGIWHEDFKTTMMNANFEHPSYTCIYIYNPKLDSTLSLTERFAVTDYLCQYQVAPGHDWQMHLSPSTRYGRLANGFLVGFKPHAGFSFPTTLMSFPWQGYQFNVFKSRKPIMIITLHTQSVKFDWIPPLTPGLDWYFGILSIESRTIHKRLQDCQSLDIIYIYM